MPSSTGSSLISTTFSVLQNPVIEFVVALGLAIGWLAIGTVIISRLVSNLKQRVREHESSQPPESQEKVASTIGDMVYPLLMVFNVGIGLQILGFDVGVLLGGISFGVGFALHKILGNMVAGVMLITNKNIKIGDTVQIVSMGLTGKIVGLTIRYTILKTFDRRRVIIPNMEIIAAVIKTLSAEPLLRVTFDDLSLNYQSDLATAKQLIINVINAHPGTSNPEATSVIVTGSDDSGLTIQAICYRRPGVYPILRYKSDIRKQIYQAFQSTNGAIDRDYAHTVIDFKQ